MSNELEPKPTPSQTVIYQIRLKGHLSREWTGWFEGLFLVGLYKSGGFIAQVPYGVWLFPLGYLVLKSGFLLKIFGVLLIADGVCQFVYVCQRLTLPDLAIIAYPCLVISFIAEVSLAFWLSIKAVKPRLSVNPE